MAPRSTGCANCRKRKIKCDEGRPGCRKCQIHNSACPGYRGLKADGLEWRDETQAVVRRVERARKRSGSLSNISNDSGSSPRDLSNSLGSSNNGGSIVVDSSVDVVGGGGDDHGTNNSNRNFAPPTKGVKELSLADKEKQYHQQAPPPPPGAITKPNNDTAAAANPVTTRRKTSTKKPSTAKQNSVIIPQAIFSAATNRSQMFDVSMRLYRPATLDEQPLRAHISDFSCLQKTITAKSSPALLAAVDTISLLQLGVSYQDDMFFEQARRRYGQALACLVVALNKPDVLGNNDVLGAMKLLEFCELFRPVAAQGSWISHVNGVENFLLQRGPVPLKTELDNMLFFHARHSSILQGVLKRKALAFAEPAWMAITKNTTYTDSSPRLFDVLVHIPGLFERADKFLAADDSTYVHGLTTDLATAITKLQAWEHEYHDSLPGAAFTSVDVGKFKRFSSLCSNMTFPLAIDFPDFLTGYLQSIYWLYLFAIQATLMELLTKYPDTRCSHSRDYVNRQLLQNAIYMCQMLAYFCEPEASSMGRFATFMPLVFALKYFEKRGMKAQLDWCRDVTDAVFNDGINPPWRLDLAKGLEPGEKKQIA